MKRVEVRAPDEREGRMFDRVVFWVGHDRQFANRVTWYLDDEMIRVRRPSTDYCRVLFRYVVWALGPDAEVIE